MGSCKCYGLPAGSSQLFSLNIDIQFPVYSMMLYSISYHPSKRTDPAYRQDAKRCVQQAKLCTFKEVFYMIQ